MPPAPQSPNPNFDFMFKDQPPARRGLPLPTLNLPKPVKIALAVVGVIIILIIISSLLSGRSNGKFQPFLGVLARGQETLRVTGVAQQLGLQDPQTQALAATITSTLTSDQAQVENYLTLNHIKTSSAQLAADKDGNSDISMQTAAQNNNLDQVLDSYLKAALARYQTDLQTAYKTAGPNGKKLLSTAYDSAGTLLSNPPLKTAFLPECNAAGVSAC